MAHVSRPRLWLYNYAEPKCRSTPLSLQAEHCRKRAAFLEQTGQDIGEWADQPMAQVTDVFAMPATLPLSAPDQVLSKRPV